MLDVLSRPVLVDGHPIQLSISIGIGAYPSDCDDAEALWHGAEAALARASQLGGDRFEFHHGERDAVTRPSALEKSRRALAAALESVLSHE